MDSFEHPAKAFYELQFFSTLCWHILVLLASGKTLDDVAHSSVFTRPSWIPVSTLHYLHGRSIRKCLFLLPLFSLGAGALTDNSEPSLLLRIAVATTVSLYHLVETSSTNRHGEFPLLYNVWAYFLLLDFNTDDYKFYV